MATWPRLDGPRVGPHSPVAAGSRVGDGVCSPAPPRAPAGVPDTAEDDPAPLPCGPSPGQLGLPGSMAGPGWSGCSMASHFPGKHRAEAWKKLHGCLWPRGLPRQVPWTVCAGQKQEQHPARAGSRSGLSKGARPAARLSGGLWVRTLTASPLVS